MRAPFRVSSMHDVMLAGCFSDGVLAGSASDDILAGSASDGVLARVSGLDACRVVSPCKKPSS